MESSGCGIINTGSCESYAVIFREETNYLVQTPWNFGLNLSEFCNPLHFRAEEKRILDSVMGPAVYDSRIRPAGINGTGEAMSTFVFSFLKRIQLVYWLCSCISVFDINYECDCSELNITSCF